MNKFFRSLACYLVFPLMAGSIMIPEGLDKNDSEVSTIYDYETRTGISFWGKKVNFSKGNIIKKTKGSKENLEFNVSAGILDLSFSKPNDSTYIEKLPFRNETYVYTKKGDSWKLENYIPEKKSRDFKENLEGKVFDEKLAIDISPEEMVPDYGDTTRFVVFGEKYKYYKEREDVYMIEAEEVRGDWIGEGDKLKEEVVMKKGESGIPSKFSFNYEIVESNIFGNIRYYVDGVRNEI